MPHVPRLFCSSSTESGDHCGSEMRPEKIGERVRVDLANGDPYYLISLDRWTCSGCGISVLLSGPAQRPIAHHFEPDFDEREFATTVRLAR